MSEHKEEFNMKSGKLGIIKLGRAAGKVKYVLVDEGDMDLVQRFYFEPMLQFVHNHQVNGLSPFPSSAPRAGTRSHPASTVSSVPELKPLCDHASVSLFDHEPAVKSNLCGPLGSAFQLGAPALANPSPQSGCSESCRWRIEAVARRLHASPFAARPRMLKELVWQRHMGGVPYGCRIAFRSGIAMDCRLSNLCIEADPESDYPYRYRRDEDDPAPCSPPSNLALPTPEQLVYINAILQIPIDPYNEQFFQSEPLATQTSNVMTMPALCSPSAPDVPLGSQSTPTSAPNPNVFECHHAPCSLLEARPLTFSVCGRCQRTRYCSPRCQQLDWPLHKLFCIERASNSTLRR